MPRRLALALVCFTLLLGLPAVALLQQSPARQLVNQVLDLVQQRYRGLTQVDYPALRAEADSSLDRVCQGSADCSYAQGGEVVDEVLAKLNDGHTFRLSPDRFLEYRADGGNAPRLMIGLKVDLVPGRGALIVTRVKRDSPAARAGIARGDLLWAVNDQKLPAFTSASDAQEYLLSLELKGNPMRLELSTRGAIGREIAVKPEMLEPWTPIYTLRPDGTAFITFYQFVTTGHIASRVQDFMTQVRKANVRAVIVDVRGSGGGAASETFSSVDALLDRTNLKFVNVTPPALADPSAPTFRRLTSTFWNGQIIVLTNHLSRSAAEYLAAGLQPSERVTVIGEPTAGVLNSGTNVYKLMDGGAIAITSAASASRPKQVTPGILQTDNMDVLSRGRDLVLEQALKRLKQP